MRSFSILCLFLCTAWLSSCKQEPAAQQEGAAAQPPAPTASNTPSSPNSPSTKAADKVTHDMSQGHDYTFLTDKILLYKNSFGGDPKAKERPYKDEWIDLTPDGKFTAGKLRQQTHTGLWSYNHDTRTLFLRPDDSRYKMSEWHVQFNDDMLVWVGTATYGDNNVQIQLVRTATLP